ncbi:MAG TPA: RNA polymerase sporulation sigma factor SigK [Syntrophothermus lipocalidus]|uniref:RNA polymerase sigma factor n=1 Tax=Syntrophothermus lipocalidus (strain DSM 12680 / TGB-C1) TaxID=643648 RepID=D7CKE2_SYNLT|nr:MULTISPECIES: RNA polymerase sporulation sigma factor SigK [Syntrophothermus]ADI01177.1 RNA polymerase, sigma 28 subunit, FliA/WhiG subfamily [Syntrophothermus lipocalidus DSM 12680]NSW81847.1 RNA polymerase sporulation sigma factor SigK [Syntrophothermus sp.]HHV77571.1 RNA polymerase sporulation sigma factor SigK [Syntrophothermus lipocalidus]HOV43388.1 RNA polymerase sporulation sigma factor SigK [Syntrophothermus lipocalidus]
MTILGWALAIFSLTKGMLMLFSYLNNLVFPHPLSEEEERIYLEKTREGDEEAKHILIEHNLRLVAHVIKKFEGTGEDTEDLISIGTIGLIKAINTFDYARGTRLATYAARCIENEVLMWFRNSRKVKQEVSIYEPIGYDKEGNEITFLDILTTDNEIVDVVETRLQEEKIRQKLGALSKRERQVIEMRYGLFSGLKATQREIARKLGISRSYVSRIEKRALKKLIREINLDVLSV